MTRKGTPVRCAESVRVQEYFDGELDASASLDLERHVENCRDCGELLQSLGDTRELLRRELPAFQAPAGLRSRIARVLDAEDGSAGTPPPARSHRSWRLSPFWRGGLSGAAATLAAGAVAFWVLALPVANPVVEAVLDAHVHSLSSAHLTEVVSTDKHTVKPWFAGHADVAPTVADFASEGYTLKGGRVDDFEHQRAAVLVYQHGAHIVNVFCWVAPRRPLPGNTTRHGYHLAFWRSGDLAYAAVSDTDWDELAALERLMRRTADGAPPAG